MQVRPASWRESTQISAQPRRPSLRSRGSQGMRASATFYVGTPTALGSYRVRASFAGQNATSSVVSVVQPELRFSKTQLNVGRSFQTSGFPPELVLERVVSGVPIVLNESSVGHTQHSAMRRRSAHNRSSRFRQADQACQCRRSAASNSPPAHPSWSMRLLRAIRRRPTSCKSRSSTA